MKGACLIRPAKPGDASEIARLSEQLGYPVHEGPMKRRLSRIIREPEHLLIVCEADGGTGLAGWIHACAIQAVETEFRVEILGLVVDENARRAGIGKRLVEKVEAWATRQAAGLLSVRCSVKRSESHRFYEALGYTSTKTQTVFRKKLGGRA